ncbi:MAG: primosomal protein N', partial [Candidatus Hydrogenedentes bacterium]|nr:primosomal protein N' [Candidatus Hydrogenedentota bacterium]
MAPREFAAVVLPRPIDHSLTYRVPASLFSRVAVGMRALVPLGKRVETGYVIGLSDHAEVSPVKSLLDLPDDQPIFSPVILELCRWISEYYCCAWGEALHCAVPPGVHTQTKLRYTLIPEQLGPGRFSERQRKVIAELYKRGALSEGQLAKAIGPVALSNTLRALINRGILHAEPLATSGVSAKTETYVRLVEEKVPPVSELEALQRRAPKQAAVYLDLLHAVPERPASALCEKHQAPMTILRALETRGLVTCFAHEIYRRPDAHAGHASAEKLVLNQEQQSAHNAVTQTLTQQRFQTFLLKGITGSGKTEVYLQAIEHALALGRNAIILVPEISLTPQTVARFQARFQNAIAVLHSGLSAGERYDEWRQAHRGQVRIVVGARSAVFAPLSNVGIIVVDEEHDTSYKQAETPRYHARDVAIMRAKLCNAVCILGSATPSIESSYNTETGKSVRLELRRRATEARLPEVCIVDMRKETAEVGAPILLSRQLEQEMQWRVQAGEQVILLLNRRGYAPFVLCPQCGWVATCRDCQVSLTYHATGAYLNCHYCNARREVPQLCDECHFNPLLFMGAGTQKIEDILQRTFLHSRIERMDADTTSGKGGHAKILRRFAAQEIDILVGTQMIAKGHDFPAVTLVGVIDADIGLAFPDFRAAETTFQLLTQAAGRAGRGDRAGKVVLQTFRPQHYAIAHVVGH